MKNSHKSFGVRFLIIFVVLALPNLVLWAFDQNRKVINGELGEFTCVAIIIVLYFTGGLFVGFLLGLSLKPSFKLGVVIALSLLVGLAVAAINMGFGIFCVISGSPLDFGV